MNQPRLQIELVGATPSQQIMLNKLDKLIDNAPIEELAPVMVAAVARMLVNDAPADALRQGFLLAKFITHLTTAFNYLAIDEGIGEPRQ